jgi:hypothetical protein
MSEALRAFAALLEAPVREHDQIAAALGLPPPPAADEHTDVVVFQAYPYASVYLGSEGMLGGEARDRVAGMWRTLGVEPPAEPDHLSVLLAALATLDERDDDAGVAAGRAFYAEHVASWMPPYLATLARIGGSFHIAWARALEGLLAERPSTERLPLHLRAAPPAGEPAGLDDLLATMIAPARVGFVVVRDDLGRCANDLGLGSRAGERRFALRALLGQDPAAVLAWLAAEARRQAEAMRGVAQIAAWWSARARETAVWLDGLAAAARDA